MDELDELVDELDESQESVDESDKSVVESVAELDKSDRSVVESDRLVVESDRPVVELDESVDEKSMSELIESEVALVLARRRLCNLRCTGSHRRSVSETQDAIEIDVAVLMLAES